MDFNVQHFLGQDPTILQTKLLVNQAEILVIQAMKVMETGQSVDRLLPEIQSALQKVGLLNPSAELELRNTYRPFLAQMSLQSQDYNPFYQQRQQASATVSGWCLQEEEEVYNRMDNCYKGYGGRQDEHFRGKRDAWGNRPSQKGKQRWQRSRSKDGDRRGPDSKRLRQDTSESKSKNWNKGREPPKGPQGNKQQKQHNKGSQQQQQQQTKASGKPANVGNNEQKGKQSQPDKFYCAECNVWNVKAEDFLRHLVGNRHKKNVKGKRPRTDITADDKKIVSKYPIGKKYIVRAFYCSLCDMVFSKTKRAMDMHCRHMNHQTAVWKHKSGKAEEKKKKAETLTKTDDGTEGEKQKDVEIKKKAETMTKSDDDTQGEEKQSGNEGKSEDESQVVQQDSVEVVAVEMEGVEVKEETVADEGLEGDGSGGEDNVEGVKEGGGEKEVEIKQEEVELKPEDVMMEEVDEGEVVDETKGEGEDDAKKVGEVVDEGKGEDGEIKKENDDIKGAEEENEDGKDSS